MSKIKIELPTGKIIERKATSKVLGNFCKLFVKINKEVYSVGDGDEYLRGLPDVFRLSYSYADKKYIAYTEKDAKTFSHTQIFKDFTNVK